MISNEISPSCVVKKRDRRAYNLKWSAENAERKKASHKLWRDANKDKIAVWGKVDREQHKVKRRANQKRWREANKDHVRVKSREERHRRLGYPEPTRPRPDACDCCGGPQSGRGVLHLDHDHKTGRFRGWLCHRCNNGIGLLGDDAFGLARAALYLDRSFN